MPLLLLLLFTPLSLFALDAAPLDILRVTPSGVDVPPTNSITIEFNQTMVPLGRMDRPSAEIPVQITPPLLCEWRWISGTSLTCQLAEQHGTNPATTYNISVAAGFKSLSGDTLSEARNFSFSTARPAITYSSFGDWRSPSFPTVRVHLNQPVSASSLDRHVFLSLTTPQSTGARRVELSFEVDRDSEGLVWEGQPESELGLQQHVELRVEPGLESLSGPDLGVEERVISQFDTFPEFNALGISCESLSAQSLFIPIDHTLPTDQLCDPFSDIAVVFSAPVVRDAAKQGVDISPNPFNAAQSQSEPFDPWDGVYTYSRLGSAHTSGNHYELPLPRGLKANQDYQIRLSAEHIRDEFDRSLPGDAVLSFKTDHRHPKLHLTYEQAVLEANESTQLPLFVTNLQSIDVTYQRLNTTGLQSGLNKHFELPAVSDLAFKAPLDIRQLLLGKSGAVRATLNPNSALPGHTPERRGYDSILAQVTPFHVHTKLGHFDSLVWVTSLETGAPVEAAQVAIVRDGARAFRANAPTLAQATSDSNGIAILPGTQKLDADLSVSQDWSDSEDRLYVRVTKGGQFGLLPIDTEYKVEGDIYSYPRVKYGHIKAWGSTAQGVYRLGDKIEYKIYVRNQDGNSLVPAPRQTYTLEVFDPTDKIVYTREKVALSKFGALDGAFETEKSGAVGWYRFHLKADFTAEDWWPLTVLLSDFTPAPFKVSSELDAKLYRSGDTVRVSSSAKLHAGGPFGNAKLRVHAKLRPQVLIPQDPKIAAFNFNTWSSVDSEPLHQSDSTLDAQGEARVSFSANAQNITYGILSVESAVSDDRGKRIAAASSATFAGRDRYVGLRSPSWEIRVGEPASVEALVIDETGSPASGTEVSIEVRYNEVKATKVKGAGSAYLTKYISEWRTLTSCQHSSQEAPISCSYVPDKPGNLSIVANIKDTSGRTHSSSIYGWAVGKGTVLWSNESEFALKIVAEKNQYKVGDTARYMIQNPFPGAWALITTERFGVQKSWVRKMEHSSETLEIPVTAEHIPGFYLSALVMSPRVEKPPADGDIDLGKPAFRQGYVATTVQDSLKELNIQVTPAAQVYRPRERATVNFEVRDSLGQPAAAELAVTVLDQAVFDLIAAKSDYFDPYNGFFALEPLDLRNYNLIKMLIGRQKFEKKGASPGGDGGGGLDIRSLIKFTSYWNPAVPVDANGKASVSFDLPDNLTGWRVLAMVATQRDRFGLGQGEFKVNKPTEIRSALPNRVIEGDAFNARFTVMNRTEATRTLNVNIAALGALQPSTPTQLAVEAKPFERIPVEIKLTAAGAGEIKLRATAADSVDSDGLEVTLPVERKGSLEHAVAYGSFDTDLVREAVAVPQDIRTDMGGFKLSFAPTIVPALASTFEYMKGYPYSCWEQKLTKAVMAALYVSLKEYQPTTFSWNNAPATVTETLKLASAHQAPSGGMCYYQAKDEYASPYLSAYTALAFGWLKRDGHNVPGAVEAKLHQYLMQFLKQDIGPDFYNTALYSSVRAVALAALAQAGKLSLSELSRFAPQRPKMALFAQSHYLIAATLAKSPSAEVSQVAGDLLNHLNETGGKLSPIEELGDEFLRIHESQLRTTCAMLSGFLAAEGAVPALRSKSQLPVKLARYISQTLNDHDYVVNTQDAIFCANALTEYSQRYESAAPKLAFIAKLGTQPIASGSFKDLRDAPQSFERPFTPADPGQANDLEISRQGSGRLYYAAQLSYAPRELRADPINAGMDVRREYSVERNGEWQILKSPIRVKQGELVKVDLFLHLAGARNFVVVDDPIPGGLEPVNAQLATSSQIDAEKGKYQVAQGSFFWDFADWVDYGVAFWSFRHQELRFDSARFYSEYLPAGRYHLAYTAQAIAPGEYTILPIKAEEMYNQDTFGRGVPERLVVE